MSSVITKLQRIVEMFFRWYENNDTNANPGKGHVPSSYNTQRVVPFDEVKFKEHISKICDEPTQTKNAS